MNINEMMREVKAISVDAELDMKRANNRIAPGPEAIIPSFTGAIAAPCMPLYLERIVSAQ